MPEIEFTVEKLSRLKVAYKQAVSSGRGSFEFEGNEYVTDYAKYLIEYLEGRFHGHRENQEDL